MPEKTASNIKTVIIIAGFFITIFTGGVGYGQLKMQGDSTNQNFREHCANQSTEQKDLSKALLQLSEVNATLASEVKNLKENVADLRQEIRRMR